MTWHEIANSIVFDSVVAEDKGVYECTAYNEAGNATKLISIDVSTSFGFIYLCLDK